MNRVGVQVNEFVLKISKVTINGVQLFYDDADLEKFLHGRTLVPVVGRIKEIMLLHADNKFDRMMAEKVGVPAAELCALVQAHDICLS